MINTTMEEKRAREVIQADREAAARLFVERLSKERGGFQSWMTACTAPILLGGEDGCFEVQAFALHRQTFADEARVAERAANGWQDIATAPRDASFIDVWAGGRRWTHSYYGRKDHFSRSPWGVEGWQNCGDEEPTHWRPLPEPPIATAIRKPHS